MKCAKYECPNELGEYELKRINFKFSKWRLCKSCRPQAGRIGVLSCAGCGKSVINTGQKIFCDKCRIKKRMAYTRKNMRVYYHTHRDEIITKYREKHGYFESLIKRLKDEGYTVIPPNDKALNLSIIND